MTQTSDMNNSTLKWIVVIIADFRHYSCHRDFSPKHKFISQWARVGIFGVAPKQVKTPFDNVPDLGCRLRCDKAAVAHGDERTLGREDAVLLVRVRQPLFEHGHHLLGLPQRHVESLEAADKALAVGVPRGRRVQIEAGLGLVEAEADPLLFKVFDEVAKLFQVEAVRVNVLHLADGQLDGTRVLRLHLGGVADADHLLRHRARRRLLQNPLLRLSSMLLWHHHLQNAHLRL